MWVLMRAEFMMLTGTLSHTRVRTVLANWCKKRQRAAALQDLSEGRPSFEFREASWSAGSPLPLFGIAERVSFKVPRESSAQGWSNSQSTEHGISQDAVSGDNLCRITPT